MKGLSPFFFFLYTSIKALNKSLPLHGGSVRCMKRYTRYIPFYVWGIVTWLTAVAQANYPPLFFENLQTIHRRSGYEQLKLHEGRLRITPSSTWSRLYTPLTKEFLSYIQTISKEISIHFKGDSADFSGKFFLQECYFSLRSLEELYTLHQKQPRETNALHNALEAMHTAIDKIPQKIKDWAVHSEKKTDGWDLSYLESTHLESVENHGLQALRLLRFTPTTVSEKPYTAKKRIVFPILHGTQFSLFSHVGRKFSEEKEKLYLSFKLLSQTLADQENQEVDLVILNWSGANTNEARIKTGTALANLLETHFPADQYDDCALGVSHGGNVLFWAYHMLESYHRSVKKMILIATPHRADFPPPALQPGGIFYNFYNPWDVTQYLGSFEITARPSTKAPVVDPRRLYPSQALPNEIHNFQVYFDSRNPYHPEMKYLALALHRLFQQKISAEQLHFTLNLHRYLEVKRQSPFLLASLEEIDIELTPDEGVAREVEKEPKWELAF